MKLSEIASQKLKSIQYLVAKGYPLKKSLIILDQSPSYIQLESATKRVIKYTLFDKTQEIVDTLFLEYGPCSSSIEDELNNLLIH